jgi:hypothetical protein
MTARAATSAYPIEGATGISSNPSRTTAAGPLARPRSTGRESTITVARPCATIGSARPRTSPLWYRDVIAANAVDDRAPRVMRNLA